MCIDVHIGLGVGISGIAVPLLVLGATGSAAKAAIVGASHDRAAALCSLPASVLADRYRRKVILIWTPLIGDNFLTRRAFWLPLSAGGAAVMAVAGLFTVAATIANLAKSLHELDR